MPVCPQCGKEALETDRFCLNCGQPLNWMAQPLPTPLPVSGMVATAPPSKRKSPWSAAILNFFLPGLGYIYLGIGRDTKLAIFGLLILLSLTLTFYLNILNLAITGPGPTPSSVTTSPSALDYVAILEFIFPFAVAYDGFQRANRP